MDELMQLQKMRLEILNDINDESKDDIFKMKLLDAKIIALNTLFPFHDTKVDIDENNVRLRDWQVRCAIELYNKIGNENISSYSENGLSVTFLEGVISSSLLKELVPKVGVPS